MIGADRRVNQHVPPCFSGEEFFSRQAFFFEPAGFGGPEGSRVNGLHIGLYPVKFKFCEGQPEACSDSFPRIAMAPEMIKNPVSDLGALVGVPGDIHKAHPPYKPGVIQKNAPKTIRAFTHHGFVRLQDASERFYGAFVRSSRRRDIESGSRSGHRLLGFFPGIKIGQPQRADTDPFAFLFKFAGIW